MTIRVSRRTFWSGIFVVVTALGATYWYSQKSHQTKVSYREFTLEKGRLDIKIESTGTVQPENRLDIKPPIAGRIEQVLVVEGQKVHKGQLLAWMSSTERAALMDAARARGPAEVKRWEKLYRSTPILAPINGTIIQRNVESGQTFAATDPVLVMSDRLTVKAQVDETDIAQVGLKQDAKIILDAYPNQSIEAHVDKIAYDARTVSNVTTYIVDVLPLETPEFMRSGMTANVTFYVPSRGDMLAIPNEFVKLKEKQHFTLVRNIAGAIVERIIEVGLTDGQRTEIVSGLQPGEIVLFAEPRPAQDQGGNNPFSPFGKKKRSKK